MTVYLVDQDVPTVLGRALAALEKLGYRTGMDVACCQRCAWGLMEPSDKAVFGSGADAKDLKQHNACDLAWAGDPVEICRVLNEHGLYIKAPLKPDQRIRIMRPVGMGVIREYAGGEHVCHRIPTFHHLLAGIETLANLETVPTDLNLTPFRCDSIEEARVFVKRGMAVWAHDLVLSKRGRLKGIRWELYRLGADGFVEYSGAEPAS